MGNLPDAQLDHVGPYENPCRVQVDPPANGVFIAFLAHSWVATPGAWPGLADRSLQCSQVVRAVFSPGQSHSAQVAAFDHPKFGFELKHDGFRSIAYLDGPMRPDLPE